MQLYQFRSSTDYFYSHLQIDIQNLLDVRGLHCAEVGSAERSDGLRLADGSGYRRSRRNYYLSSWSRIFRLIWNTSSRSLRLSLTAWLGDRARRWCRGRHTTRKTRRTPLSVCAVLKFFRSFAPPRKCLWWTSRLTFPSPLTGGGRKNFWRREGGRRISAQQWRAALAARLYSPLAEEVSGEAPAGRRTERDWRNLRAAMGSTRESDTSRADFRVWDAPYKFR